MTPRRTFDKWLARALEDTDLQIELDAMESSRDEATIGERFSSKLTFGTGGLRAFLGAGTDRMNIYTVRAAAQSVAVWLGRHYDTPFVAIAYDSRHKSELFAGEAARVLAANGTTAWLYPRLMPTPALSFAVRRLGCDAGICITASHNPAEYNGFNVYGRDGGQITPDDAERIAAAMDKTDPFDSVNVADFGAAVKNGFIRIIGEDVVDDYLNAVLLYNVPAGVTPEAGGVGGTAPMAHGAGTPPAGGYAIHPRVVYTPLCGTGLECVSRALGDVGIRELFLVPGQSEPDGNFPTCPSPNPENPAVYAEGLKIAKRQDADLLLATDPDCDRIGVCAKEIFDYRLLSGNELGALLFDYVCRMRVSRGEMPPRPLAVKTVVTSGLIGKIADEYKVELQEVLTGFKYIGETVTALEKKGEAHRFIFGLEESCGYLAGSYVRDKDAVSAAVLVCEMTRFYKSVCLSLPEALERLYKRHGHYANTLHTHTFAGTLGTTHIQSLMQALRQSPPRQIGGRDILFHADYLYAPAEADDTRTMAQTAAGGYTHAPLPPADMLEYRFESGARVFVRPSGTEPKIKIYTETTAHGKALAETENALLARGVADLLGLSETPEQNNEPPADTAPHFRGGETAWPIAFL